MNRSSVRPEAEPAPAEPRGNERVVAALPVPPSSGTRRRKELARYEVTELHPAAGAALIPKGNAVGPALHGRGSILKLDGWLPPGAADHHLSDGLAWWWCPIAVSHDSGQVKQPLIEKGHEGETSQCNGGKRQPKIDQRPAVERQNRKTIPAASYALCPRWARWDHRAPPFFAEVHVTHRPSARAGIANCAGWSAAKGLTLAALGEQDRTESSRPVEL